MRDSGEARRAATLLAIRAGVPKEGRDNVIKRILQWDALAATMRKKTLEVRCDISPQLSMNLGPRSRWLLTRWQK